VLAISTSLVGIEVGRAVVALMSDVTGRKRVEEALRQSHIQLASAQRLAKLGSWWFDIRAGTVWWSDELYHLFGKDPATFRPSLESFLSLVHPDDVSMIRDRLERAVRDNAPYRYECRIVRPDGSIWWKRTEGVLERDADGDPIRLWGTTQDVTEQRQAEESRAALEDRLREARRLESIGVLAGGIAHEFNNLLTAIIGHAELAENELPPRHPLHSHLAPIRDAAGRAADLCRKMLAYAGRGRVVVEQLDFNELIRQSIQTLDPAMAVNLSCSDSRAPVRGDAEQIRQMLTNLIANAVEAAPRGTLHLATRREMLDAGAIARLRHTPGLMAGEYQLFEVRDEGPGMDEGILERAFEPFFSTKFPGRGLGLAVVLGVIRGHRGGLDILTGPGRGTTVRVYLPPGD
jgi:PAS domain S-box-containing protein